MSCDHALLPIAGGRTPGPTSGTGRQADRLRVGLRDAVVVPGEAAERPEGCSWCGPFSWRAFEYLPPLRSRPVRDSGPPDE